MINVPQITADLARMPDRSLQQYAQMHRDDPYIVALALAESNRRKQLRIGAQAGQAQQMPTVVEQDISQMAPEQVGIGSLPEQSLAKMAGGGIVAFEEGGEVEHYAAGDLVGDKGFLDFLQKNGKTVRDFVNALPSEQAAIKAAYTGVQGPAVPAATVTPTTAPTTAGASSSFKAGLGAINRSPIPWLGLATQLFGTSDEELAVLRAADKKRKDEAQQKYDQDVAAGRLPAGPIGKSTFSTDVSQGTLRDIAFDKDKTPVPLPKDYAEKTADTTAPAAPSTTMQDALKQAQELIGGSQPGATSGITSLMSQLPKAYDPTADINAAKTELKSTFGDTEKFDRAASLAERKKIGEDYYSKAQALIDKEEGKTKSDTEQAGFMALLEAGLGIMGGTSQHAMVNIGQGGKAAMANFGSAMKDIRKASRENEKMRLDLERLKAADARGDIDAVDRLEDSVKNRNATMKSHLASGLAQLDVAGTNAKGHASSSEISAIASLLTNQLTNQTHLQTTGMQLQGSLASKIFEANQPTAEIKSMQQYLANPELAKLREKFLTAATGLRGEDALLAQYAKNPALLMVLEKTEPVEAARIRQLLSQRMGGGIMAPTTSGASGASNKWGPADVVKP
jgi:hypothetical protein